MPLTHYLVVRRDLPLGTCLAMVAHAAGESFYLLADGQRSHPDELFFDPSQTRVVVFGARNAERLTKLERILKAADVPHICIRETEGVYAGEAMAIGLVPCGEAGVKTVQPLLNVFQLLRELDGPR